MHVLVTQPLARIASFMILISAAASVSAAELDFRLSNDTIGGGIESNSPESELSVGFEHFYKDADKSINISSLNLHTKGQTVLGNMPTTVALGMQGVYMKEDTFKASAIAFGGSMRVNLPSSPGLSIQGQVHYAPDIVAFGDSDSYTKVRTQLNYRVIRSADISAGYQYLQSGIKAGGNRTFESGLYLGLKIIF
jgi:YfaZ precursor